ncbi:MAG: VF530 family DNA-binding protein [Bacteriovoracaceae bacterium]|nr:VF530 family DNA-binding protein [Bacteriovoracaceae bacterium]
MKDNNSNDPLHGITLKMMLADVIDFFGYKKLHEMTEIRSFGVEYPRLNPVLKFLRKTPWAREKVETIYKDNIDRIKVHKTKKKK